MRARRSNDWPPQLANAAFPAWALSCLPINIALSLLPREPITTIREMPIANGLESHLTSDCRIEYLVDAGTRERSHERGSPDPARLAFQGTRSRCSACNEGSLWRYQSLISANSFAPTANVVRASFPLTLPECRSKERILGASFLCFAHHGTRASTGRRTARSKGLRSHRCHCAALSKNK